MEFNKYRLKDLAEYKNERIETNQLTTENYISTENLLPNKQGKQPASNLPSSKTVKKYTESDILISNIRPYFKKIWQADNIGGISNDILNITSSNEKISNDYLYYYLSQDTFFQYMTQTSKGTKMPRGDKEAIMKFEIQVPKNVKYQNFISNLGKFLDNKIEINNKIIANLEELSQTLFKCWFVDFEFPDKDGNPYKSSGGEMVDSELGEIPKEWQVVKLETLIDNVKDRINAKSVSNNFPYVPIDLIPKRKLTFYNYEDGKEAKSSLIKFKRNDILLGNMRVYFHRVCLAPFEGVTRNTVFTLRPKDEKYTYYLINLINKDEFIEYASNNSKGSTMPYAVWEGVLDKIKVIKPPLNYLNQFNSKIKSNFELSISLLKQNRKLAILRDTLLPKLMSGEVEIPNDIEVNTDELSI